MCSIDVKEKKKEQKQCPYYYTNFQAMWLLSTFDKKNPLLLFKKVSSKGQYMHFYVRQKSAMILRFTVTLK